MQLTLAAAAAAQPPACRASHSAVCPQNVMAWLVAGGLAYYLYVVPAKAKNDEQEVCGALAPLSTEHETRSMDAQQMSHCSCCCTCSV